MIYIIRTYRPQAIKTGVFVTQASDESKAIQKVRLYIQKGGCQYAALTDKCVPQLVSSTQTLFDSEITIVP